MEQKILKTRIGRTFTEKTKILSWKITHSDTRDTKLGGNTYSFKEKVKNNLS